MSGHCHACTAPLASPDFQGPSEIYCKYCADAQGKLRPFTEVQDGIAGWFMGWQPNVTKEIALKRAAAFMKGLPAWADE